MKHVIVLFLSAVALAGCAPSRQVLSQNAAAQINDSDSGEMQGGTQATFTGALFQDLSLRQAEYQAFVRVLAASGHATVGKRELYERYLDSIGANGILAGITQLWPTCHSEAHALGQVIEEHVRNVGAALRVCRDGCYSGCMHGVLMEAYAGARDSADPEGHVNLDTVKSLMKDICTKNDAMISSYSPGDCAHATGHALMVLAEYDIPKAMTYRRRDGAHGKISRSSCARTL